MGRANPRLVVAGGGVAGLEAVLALRALAQDRVSIDVIAPEHEFAYRPLAVAEPFRAADVQTFPLQPLVQAAGAELRSARVTAVDSNRHMVVTGDGSEIAYDFLLLALGAQPVAAVENALAFRGTADGPALAEILEQALVGAVHRLVFAVPAGAAWPLPAYELALLTANYLADHGARGIDVTVVTPEESPLAVFGITASSAVRELLELRGIGLVTHATPLRFENETLEVAPFARIEADRVVALPRLEGPRLPGIDHDQRGFVATDELGRVVPYADVYAAGDMTQFPLKQGGIAAQQADVAAAAIASRVGVDLEVAPFRPVLRGLLLTGMVPRYLRAEPGTGRSVVDTATLWWPPAKIVGRYLSPFLAERLGLDPYPPPADGVRVEIELEASPGAAPAG